MLGEDVQDQRGPVDDLDLDVRFEGTQLGRGQFAVADHGVGPGREHDVAQLGHLAPADVRGRVGAAAPLDQPVEDQRAGGLGERGQLGEGVLRVGDGPLGPHTDQHDAFQAQPAVLDLGDVGEFGGQSGDPP